MKPKGKIKKSKDIPKMTKLTLPGLDTVELAPTEAPAKAPKAKAAKAPAKKASAKETKSISASDALDMIKSEDYARVATEAPAAEAPAAEAPAAEAPAAEAPAKAPKAKAVKTPKAEAPAADAAAAEAPALDSDHPVKPIEAFKKSPLQAQVYNDLTEDTPGMKELAASIKEKGVLVPVVVDQDGVVMSGYRRLFAAELAGFTVVPYNTKTFANDDERLEYLITYNMQRVKTPKEMFREGTQLLEVYRKKPEKKGRKTDLVAKDIGLKSGKNFERLQNIFVNACEKVQAKVDSGEMSINAADQLVRNVQKHKPEVQALAWQFIQDGQDEDRAIRNAFKQVKEAADAAAPAAADAADAEATDAEATAPDNIAYINPKYTGNGTEAPAAAATAEAPAKAPAAAKAPPVQLPAVKAAKAEAGKFNGVLAFLFNEKLSKAKSLSFEKTVNQLKELCATDAVTGLLVSAENILDAHDVLDSLGMSYLTTVAVRYKKLLNESTAAIQEDTAFLVIGERGSCEPGPNPMNTNFIDVSKSDPMNQTPKEILNVFHALTSGSLVKVGGPVLTAEAVDDGWTAQ